MNIERINYDIGLKYEIGSTIFYNTIHWREGKNRELELKGKVIAYWKDGQQKGYIVYFDFFYGSLHLLEKNIYIKRNSIKKL